MEERNFRTLAIDLNEVENGYEIGIDWSFNECSSDANQRNNSRNFVAKTEKEALEIIVKEVRALPKNEE